MKSTTKSPITIEELEKKLAAVDGCVANLSETKNFFAALDMAKDITNTYITTLQNIVVSVAPMMVAIEGARLALVPYLAEARKLLRMAGPKGGFSKFLTAIGNPFPRATIDRWLDKYETAQSKRAGAEAGTGEGSETEGESAPQPADRKEKDTKITIDFFTNENKLQAEKYLSTIYGWLGTDNAIGRHQIPTILLFRLREAAGAAEQVQKRLEAQSNQELAA